MQYQLDEKGNAIIIQDDQGKRIGKQNGSGPAKVLPSASARRKQPINSLDRLAKRLTVFLLCGSIIASITVFCFLYLEQPTTNYTLSHITSQVENFDPATMWNSLTDWPAICGRIAGAAEQAQADFACFCDAIGNAFDRLQSFFTDCFNGVWTLFTKGVPQE